MLNQLPGDKPFTNDKLLTVVRLCIKALLIILGGEIFYIILTFK